MPRNSIALTKAKVRTLTKGKYADGNGLYLVVDSSGARRWVLRVLVNNMSTKGGSPKRMEVGLGGASHVDLDEARAKALQLRKIAKQGGNPLHAEGRTVPSFEKLAREVFEQMKDTWSNGKHQQQWMNTLKDNAFAEIGSMRVDHITQADVLRVLSPIWTAKNETARRVMQRIGKVLDVASASGFRSGDNPVRLIKAGNILPKVQKGEKHHASMPWAQLPAFWQKLCKLDVVSAYALQFLILTASRTVETVEARWSEIDLDYKVWSIPADRMKGRRAHSIPLCDQSCTLLSKLIETKRSEYIFEGSKSGAPISNMAMSALLKRMEITGITIHGFRSSFRDWCGDNGVDRALAELSLAHTIGNAVELAYARSDMLERRRLLIQSWGNFIEGVKTSNNVISITGSGNAV